MGKNSQSRCLVFFGIVLFIILVDANAGFDETISERNLKKDGKVPKGKTPTLTQYDVKDWLRTYGFVNLDRKTYEKDLAVMMSHSVQCLFNGQLSSLDDLREDLTKVNRFNLITAITIKEGFANIQFVTDISPYVIVRFSQASPTLIAVNSDETEHNAMASEFKKKPDNLGILKYIYRIFVNTSFTWIDVLLGRNHQNLFVDTKCSNGRSLAETLMSSLGQSFFRTDKVVAFDDDSQKKVEAFLMNWPYRMLNIFTHGSAINPMWIIEFSGNRKKPFIVADHLSVHATFAVVTGSGLRSKLVFNRYGEPVHMKQSPDSKFADIVINYDG